jgi:hypothetical protein
MFLPDYAIRPVALFMLAPVLSIDVPAMRSLLMMHIATDSSGPPAFSARWYAPTCVAAMRCDAMREMASLQSTGGEISAQGKRPRVSTTCNPLALAETSTSRLQNVPTVRAYKTSARMVLCRHSVYS